jgi:hypothetical protein
LEARPFFPASWVDVGDDEHGLTYFHAGTPKHWVTGGLLNNLLAWGDFTDAIGNRLDNGRWPKTFDQRLRGTHALRAGVYPHTGDWRAANVIGTARSFANPLAGFLHAPTSGHLPSEQTVLALVGDAIAATAIAAHGEQISVRCYSTGRASVPAVHHARLRPDGLFALNGDALAALGPFQIGVLKLALAPASP